MKNLTKVGSISAPKNTPIWKIVDEFSHFATANECTILITDVRFMDDDNVELILHTDTKDPKINVTFCRIMSNKKADEFIMKADTFDLVQKAKKNPRKN